MVETTPLRHELLNGDGAHVLKTKLRKKIRDRVETCDVPDCWILKGNDSGLLSLDRRFFGGNLKRGKHMTMRQALFQLTFHEMPPVDRIIKMQCGDSRCVNPAHYSVAGWKMPFETMAKLIYHLEWISEKEAVQMHAGKTYAAWYLRHMEDPLLNRRTAYKAPEKVSDQ